MSVDLQRSEARASWKLRDRGLQVTLQLAGDALGVDFVADEIGVLAWPSVAPGAAIRGWIVPLFEGLYVPADDRRWVSFLAKDGPLDTTADLILPFWGLDFGGFTTTCIVVNPFNNRLKFEDASGRLGMRLAHEFTRNHSVKQFGLRISAGPPSPIEPALEYRRWLQANGRFVSFEEKIRRTPEAEKLLGAVHVYLWGEGLLSADDVRDWRGFARRLQEQGDAAAPSPGKRLWSMLDDEAHRNIITVGGAQPADRYTKGQVAEAVGRALERPDFYEEGAWSGVALDGITEALTKRKATDLSISDLCRRNCGLLAAAFGAFHAPLDTWGDGMSPPMIRQLADEGFDRLWLGAEGWSGFVKRPETVATARAKGYLIGTYDSYHSIHEPGEADTWPTAQFDAELYSKGAIVQADGTKKRGFQRKGYLLSPKAARPWVEKRVSGLMAIFHANSWFIDCDAFGQYYDDYWNGAPCHTGVRPGRADVAHRLHPRHLRRGGRLGELLGRCRLDASFRARGDYTRNRVGRPRLEGPEVEVLPRRLLPAERAGRLLQERAPQGGVPLPLLRSPVPPAPLPGGLPRLGHRNPPLGIAELQVHRRRRNRGAARAALRRAATLPPEPSGTRATEG